MADLIFTLTQSVPFVSNYKPFHTTFKLSFSNKGDGIQSVILPINKGSDLRMPRYAPENGYEPVLIKEMGRPSEDKPIEFGYRADQNYFFRVRAVMDGAGNIKSALYGKIRGDISSGFISPDKAGINFIYYLNPNPNDRNMEFDPKHNLFRNLSPLEKIASP